MSALLLLTACRVSSDGWGEERRVATIPEGMDVWWFSVSPGGTSAAFAERRERQAYLHFGGREYGPFP